MMQFSYAHGVNRHGQVVGSSHGNLGGSRTTAFLWDGTMVVDLVAPIGLPNASAINDFGIVVGNAYDPATMISIACLWEDGVFVDLNTFVDPALGWVLSYASDIDNEGRILGQGTLNGAPAGFILEPDCKGTFTAYGAGCAGAAGVEPQLRGSGCPAPNRDFALEIVDGVPSAVGLLFLGSGTGTIQVKPGCDLQVLPLVPPVFLLALESLGEWWDHERFPAGTPIFDLNLQAFFFDPGAAHGISGTKPLALHFE